jgi:small-conductance mechanosensitive channel
VNVVERGLDRLNALPDWAVAAVLFTAALLLSWGFRVLILRRGSRLVGARSPFLADVFAHARGPVSLALLMGALALAASLAPITERSADIVRHVMLVCFILLVAWTTRVVLDLWLRAHLKRFRLDTDDNLMARKHVTQMRILLRVADTLIVVLALGAVLMTFEGVRQYGVSLLASAGAAGIVVGLALQPVLKNLFAGIQLAITQPIRIDDAVIVEGEWGNIEEITATYVVVRIWDLRRLIVPLSHFIEKPFQNWTREEANLLGVVTIYLDYRAPVAEIRTEVERIVTGSKLWDGETAVVQVTDFREQVMEVRVLASARNAGDAFTLRCEIRERLVGWLQRHHPEALPRLRIDGTIEDRTGSPAAAGETRHEHGKSPA